MRTRSLGWRMFFLSLLPVQVMLTVLQGNKGRKVTRDLMARFPAEQTNPRGIVVDSMIHSVSKGMTRDLTSRVRFPSYEGC